MTPQDPRHPDPAGGPGDALPADPAFQRMLAHAPDRGDGPRAATREAILAAAHGAVAAPAIAASAPSRRVASPAVPKPWWKRLWTLQSGGRMPWNTAFATVLVGMFVTVLWHREPVPQAGLDRDGPVRMETAPAPAHPAPTPGPRAQSSPAPAPGAAQASRVPDAPPPVPAAAAPQPPVPASPAAPAAPSPAARASATQAAQAPSTAPEAPSAPSRGLSPPQATARAQAARPWPVPGSANEAADAKVDRAEDGLAAREGSTQERPGERHDFGRPRQAAPAAPAPAAAMPAPAQPLRDRALLGKSPDAGLSESEVAAQAGQAPSAERRARAGKLAVSDAWRHWTHLLIADGAGNTRRLDRNQAGPLVALLEAVIPAAADGAAPMAAPGRVPVAWRISLAGAGGPLGVLEVPAAPADGIRWRPDGAPAVVSRPAPAVLDALRGWLS